MKLKFLHLAKLSGSMAEHGCCSLFVPQTRFAFCSLMPLFQSDEMFMVLFLSLLSLALNLTHTTRESERAAGYLDLRGGRILSVVLPGELTPFCNVTRDCKHFCGHYFTSFLPSRHRTPRIEVFFITLSPEKRSVAFNRETMLQLD